MKLAFPRQHQTCANQNAYCISRGKSSSIIVKKISTLTSLLWSTIPIPCPEILVLDIPVQTCISGNGLYKYNYLIVSFIGVMYMHAYMDITQYDYRLAIG